MPQLPTRLVDAADALLSLVVRTGDDYGVQLPARRYVTAGGSGNEAWDDEQVVVGLLSYGPVAAAAGGGDQFLISPAPAGALSLPTATLRVEITRAHPSLGAGETAPTPKQETAAGRVSLIDAELLTQVRNRIATRGLLQDEDRGGDVQLGNVLGLGPEGGMTGVALTVAVTLP